MRTWKAIAFGSLSLLAFGLVWSLEPRSVAFTKGEPPKEFARDEMGVSIAAVRLRDALPDLLNRGEWEAFVAREGEKTRVRIDPRSARPATILTRVPMIPGGEEGGRQGATEVGDFVKDYIRKNRSPFRIDVGQLGPVMATQVAPEVWHISIPQQVEQVPVRGARIIANISHGSLVLFGTALWGDVRTSPRPKFSAEEAIPIALGYVAPPGAVARISEVPRLEFLPVLPPGREQPHRPGQDMADRYGHRLAWIIQVLVGPDSEPWEVGVEAHAGEVMFLKSLVVEANKSITGTTAGGTVPMPWADTGFSGSKAFTFGSGVYDYVSGTATTTLSGKYVKVTDPGGSISSSDGSGGISLSGNSGGNTIAARTTFYEANRMAEIGRGYRPDNAWLSSQLPARTNTTSACSASWNGTEIRFGTGTQCGNPGEIQSIIAHEWGHGFDANDGTALGPWSEGVADVAANYRTQASCLGAGLWTNHPGNDQGCGMDELLHLGNESNVTATHCLLNCTGKRDSDYATHEGGEPDTVENFVCDYCATGNGPCDRESHCAAAPMRQAAWDLAARDLQAAPYHYDATTAFNIASRLFYLGSQNIVNWHTCDCQGEDPFRGCNADSGYLQWLDLDDNDDDRDNGTPHMTAIYNAFHRHGIACDEYEVQDATCSSGPASAATLTAVARCGAVDLSWTSVGNAAKYRVFRGEGPNACGQGKAIVGSPGGTSFQDKNLLNGRQYCYTVMPVGANDACIAPASTCTCVTPSSNLTDVDIPAVKVTYANGGETLYKTSTVNITWDATDSCGIGSTVSIKLSTSGLDGSYSTLFSNQANTGSKSWTVSGSSSLNNAFFKVEATDGNSHTGIDTSNAAFTIRNCGPATISYCLGAEWRCTFNNTCGASGCANYSCMEDFTCAESEEPPAEAC